MYVYIVVWAIFLVLQVRKYKYNIFVYNIFVYNIFVYINRNQDLIPDHNKQPFTCDATQSFACDVMQSFTSDMT